MKWQAIGMVTLGTLLCLGLIPSTTTHAALNESAIQLTPQDVKQTYRRDDTWFTQGFEVIESGKLLMSSGKYGESKVGILDLSSGKIETKATLPETSFGEGITQTPTAIWQITYKEGLAYKRDPKTFEILETKHYEGQGWGIAYDKEAKTLWMTDGSATLQQRDPETFEILGTQTITYDKKPIERVNELEVVDGKLYANIWQTNVIVQLDPKTGEITKVYDLSAIITANDLTPRPKGKPDVLNGIAHAHDDIFYVTGKYYPVVFEVQLKAQ